MEQFFCPSPNLILSAPYRRSEALPHPILLLLSSDTELKPKSIDTSAYIGIGLRAGIFVFVVPQNVARKFFASGSGNEKFSRHNEKNLVPFFQKIQTKTCAFLVRTDGSDVYCGQKNIIHRKIRELAKRQAMANRIIEVNHRLNNYKARAKDRLNSE